MKDIIDALGQMDTLDDAVWTADGQPKLDALEASLGKKVTRAEVVAAAPHFSRENPVLPDTAEAVPDTAPKAEPNEVEEASEEVLTLIVEFKNGPVLNREEFLAFMAGIPASALKDLEAAITEQQLRVGREREQLVNDEIALTAALGWTQSRISVEVPQESDAQANMAYIQAQMELRAKRKAAQIAILKSVDLSDLDPRSALDRAMSRKTARGAQRPKMG